MHSILPRLFLASFVFACACLGQDQGPRFVPLFDGKSLKGWVSARTLAGEETVFSVDAKKQEIQVYADCKAGSKQRTDCLISEKEFSHYILKLEYKWLEKRFAPRTKYDRDAGLLFHVHGDLKKIWPLCLEMQIGESPGDKKPGRGAKGRFHSGDLFVLGKDLRAQTKRKDGHFDPEGEPETGKSCPTKLGSERPKGEWNTMEIRVQGAAKATFVLNGKVVHEISKITQKNEKGQTVPLAKGRIGLQAEWAELRYRNVRIKELKPNGTATLGG
ncbi:MAG: DUF1080 domain-containing protein [Planctomycetota bacterium]